MNNFGNIEFAVTPALVKRFLLHDMDILDNFLDDILGVSGEGEDSATDNYFVNKYITEWVNKNMASVSYFLMSGEMVKEAKPE